MALTIDSIIIGLRVLAVENPKLKPYYMAVARSIIARNNPQEISTTLHIEGVKAKIDFSTIDPLVIMALLREVAVYLNTQHVRIAGQLPEPVLDTVMNTCSKAELESMKCVSRLFRNAVANYKLTPAYRHLPATSASSRTALKPEVTTFNVRENNNRKDVSAAVMSADGGIVSACGNNLYYGRIDANGTYQPLQTWEGHTDQVNCVIALPEDLFASGSNDCTIKIWRETATGRAFVTARHVGVAPTLQRAHAERVLALLRHPNGYLISASHNSVNIWELYEGGYRCRQKFQHGGPYGLASAKTPIAILPNGGLAVLGRNIIHIWPLDIDGNFKTSLRNAMGEFPPQIYLEHEDVEDILSLSNGDLLSLSSDRARIWCDGTANPSNYHCIKDIYADTDNGCILNSIGSLPSGESLIASSDRKITLYKRSGRLNLILQVLQGHPGISATEVIGAVPRSNNAFAVSRDGTVKIFRFPTLESRIALALAEPLAEARACLKGFCSASWVTLALYSYLYPEVKAVKKICDKAESVAEIREQLAAIPSPSVALNKLVKQVNEIVCIDMPQLSVNEQLDVVVSYSSSTSTR